MLCQKCCQNKTLIKHAFLRYLLVLNLFLKNQRFKQNLSLKQSLNALHNSQKSIYKALKTKKVKNKLCFGYLRYLLIVANKSSLLNGLVKYSSEPTIRPRALSNRPSFDDSIITGFWAYSG